MTTPRGSPPMDFPPLPFALADAVSCATLVGVAYDQCQQWINQSYPPRAQFTWIPATTPVQLRLAPRCSGPMTGSAALTTNPSASWPRRRTATQRSPCAVPSPMRMISRTRALTRRRTIRCRLWERACRVQRDLQRLSPQILSILTGLTNIARFFFTGHSLGSGLSSLAVPDVITNTALKPTAGRVLLHYNFASPRVGDPQFAYMMNGNGVPTFRVVNTGDIVPDAPPSVIGTTLYKHIGTPVDFTAQPGGTTPTTGS